MSLQHYMLLWGGELQHVKSDAAPLPFHQSLSPSLVSCWLSIAIHLHQWSGGFKPWLWQAGVALSRCFLCNVGDGGRRLREEHVYMCIYVYPCVQQGILLPSLPYPGVLWVQTVCCFSSALVVCQVRLVRLRVLTLLQSVTRSDSLPNTDPLCLIKSYFFTNASVVDQWWKNPVLCDLHAAEH